MRLGWPHNAANSTLAPRKVFFLTHMSSGKTIEIICAMRGANFTRLDTLKKEPLFERFLFCIASFYSCLTL